MILVTILAVVFAIAIDFTMGDPKNKFHPTAWIGILIGKLIPIARNSSEKTTRLSGVLLTISVAIIISITLYFINIGLHSLESGSSNFGLYDLIVTILIIIITG